MRIAPAAAVRGAIAVPGAKSISHRALLLAGIADGESEIRGLGVSADVDATAAALRALGVPLELEGDTARVQGLGLRGLRPAETPIDCGNAGTLLRLLSGILAGQEGSYVLAGDASLSSRPHERIAEPLRLLGARVETTNGGAPVVIEGGKLRSIRYELPVASAQVKSAILLAGLYARPGPTTVLEPVPTRDHTERLLASCGVRIRQTQGEVAVWPSESLRPLQLEIAGDFSSAAPFVIAATLVPGSELRLAGVNVNPTRLGLLHVLERMGARVSIFNRRIVGGEPAADLEVLTAELTATSVGPAEIPSLVDELPLLALAAGCARGESVIWGAGELRAKESDRIEAVVAALRPLGVHIRATDDGFRIRGVPTRPRGGGTVDSRGDHRIAMLGAVAALASRAPVEITGAESVAVSFPGFFDLLGRVARR